MRLVNVSMGRPASTNADRRRGPRLDPENESLVRVYFELRRRTLWFPRIDADAETQR